MDEKDYCKLVFLGLINLLSFLFSIVFLICSYNIKSKEEIEGIKYVCSDEIQNLIDNHYKGNLALFIFEVLCFIFFFVSLMTYFYLIEKEENEAKIIRYQAVNNAAENVNDYTINQNKNKSCMKKIMIIMLILCQVFYLIELILVPVLYYKLNLSQNTNKELCRNIFLKNYRDMIIVGFIFLIIIFLPIYIILLVLFFKKETFSSIIFCNCFTNNISNFCQFLSNCSKKCHTSEVLKEKNSEREKQINELIKYKNDLKLMNNNWKNGKSPNEDELLKLNLNFNDSNNKNKKEK